MENENYSATILVNTSEQKAFDSINEVSGWWSENIEGNTEKLGDIFTMHSGNTFVTMKIIESVPGKKIVWYVTDGYLQFQVDRKEWNDTQMVFNISAEEDSVRITFTHVGLAPEVACYDICSKGWDRYFKGSLPLLIKEGMGQPQKKPCAPDVSIS
jgi:hypothetical protein